MTSTYATYQSMTRDMTRTTTQVESEPQVKRETDYYLANIGKVKTVDDFVNNTRLFNYAMKAFGLEDMTYAKAFMTKVLNEGVSDPDSFANKLTDPRYKAFAEAFNFAADKDSATTYVAAQNGVTDRYTLAAVQNGVTPDNPVLQQQTQDYLKQVVDVKSIDDFLNNDTVYTYAIKAFGLDAKLGDKTFMRKILEGGVSDPNSFANQQTDKNYAAFAAAFDFAAHGDEATTYSVPEEGTVDAYMRQTMEDEAGAQNPGVQLALYFQRKASSITSAYDILADKALAKVVRTALRLPDSTAMLDIDKQASMIESKLNVEDFQDPAKLGDFLKRFTSLYDIDNPSAAQQSSPTAILFSQPTTQGISTNLLLSIQQLKI
ncbi:MAG: DUF1217 domain-containing protein [Rhizobiales bacterium]|nr:DUF1217 domain-containing protein [Hyphomicrobiales bacterium]